MKDVNGNNTQKINIGITAETKMIPTKSSDVRKYCIHETKTAYDFV